MKHEWRKHEKGLYLPKQKPVLVKVPNLKFFCIEGEGNPNSEDFTERIGALYSLSYGMKMFLKKNPGIEGYQDYTVYPLEGVWDLNEQGRKEYKGTINKDQLVYKIMIRQPDFVNEELAKNIVELTQAKTKNNLLYEVSFEEIEEGECIQMLHVGPYDNEPATFAEMENYTNLIGLKRACKVHREIYLSDARKVAPEKLKTVLRFKVENP